MFDLGFSELVVIAVVALIVLGPERLPKAARFAGLWIRRGRAQWHSVRSEFEREMAADELKRSLQEAKDAVRDAAKEADGALKPPAAAAPADEPATPADAANAGTPPGEDGDRDGEGR